MKYLLDTNVCIRIINKRSMTARTKLLTNPVNDIVICSVVRAELFYGSSKSQTPESTRQKQEHFHGSTVNIMSEVRSAKDDHSRQYGRGC